MRDKGSRKFQNPETLRKEQRESFGDTGQKWCSFRVWKVKHNIPVKLGNRSRCCFFCIRAIQIHSQKFPLTLEGILGRK